MEKLPVKDTFKGPGSWFTGDVYGSPIYSGTDPSRMSATLVRFTPGARTHWHRHALGQCLHGIAVLHRLQLGHQNQQPKLVQQVRRQRGIIAQKVHIRLLLCTQSLQRAFAWGAHTGESNWHGKLSTTGVDHGYLCRYQ